ncbi:alpha/beta fold hydrolase [Streptomyces sp. NPDC003077]|uniref:alpha/beta fold hydrolase n=1 Tax=Streptomyces sp. NPDC003077 TaxID=3154443 RepID=UPI0033AC76B6
MTQETRRTVLRSAAAAGALVAGGVMAAPMAQAAAPRPRKRPPTFVFVHGANGSSYGWTPLMRDLTLLGHRALAVDLPGHGPGAYFPEAYQTPQDTEALRTEPSPLKDVTLDDYVEHVTDVVRQAHRNGPVILLGGSMGGATITRVGNVVPDLIDHLVYLSAFCCTKLRSLWDYMQTDEAEGTLMGTIQGVPTAPELGVMRTNWRQASPDFLAKTKAAVAAEYSDAEWRAQLNLFEPDETAAIGVSDARGDARTWGRIPRTYVRYSEDRMIPPALQDLMIRHADELTPHNRFTVHTVKAPHLGPRDARALVRVLDEVAGG